MNLIISLCQNKASYLESNQIRLAPVIYIIIATFITAINSLICKSIPNMNVNQITYAGGITMIILGSLIGQETQISFYQIEKKALNKIIMRSVIGCFGTLLFYTGLKYVNIAEAQVLLQTSAFWTSLISICIFKIETFTCNLITNLLICFIGITMITQPPSIMNLFSLNQTIINSENHLYGCFILVIAALFFSLVQILIKSLAGQVHQLVVMQYSSFFLIAISSLNCIFQPNLMWQAPNLQVLFQLLAVGIVAYIQQLFLNRAYMKGNLTEMAILGQTQILWAYLFDILRGAAISLLSCIGTGLIVFSFIRVILNKQQRLSNLK